MRIAITRASSPKWGCTNDLESALKSLKDELQVQANLQMQQEKVRGAPPHPTPSTVHPISYTLHPPMPPASGSARLGSARLGSAQLGSALMRPIACLFPG